MTGPTRKNQWTQNIKRNCARIHRSIFFFSTSPSFQAKKRFSQKRGRVWSLSFSKPHSTARFYEFGPIKSIGSSKKKKKKIIVFFVDSSAQIKLVPWRNKWVIVIIVILIKIGLFYFFFFLFQIEKRKKRKRKNNKKWHFYHIS